MEKIENVIVNDAILNKLDSISQDIKTYVNMNVSIALSLNDRNKESFHYFDPEDIDELISIRKRIKNLSKKVRDKRSIYYGK